MFSSLREFFSEYFSGSEPEDHSAEDDHICPECGATGTFDIFFTGSGLGTCPYCAHTDRITAFFDVIPLEEYQGIMEQSANSERARGG